MPSTSPAEDTISPERLTSSSLSESQPPVSPSLMKQMSWLSGFAATASPRAAASSRTCALGVSPSGNSECASWSWVSTPST